MSICRRLWRQVYLHIFAFVFTFNNQNLGVDNMSKKEQQIFSQQDLVLQLLMKRGLVGDDRISNVHTREAQQRKKQAAYHNTEMLLKQYKNIAWIIECFPDTIAEELEQPFENVDKLIDRLDFEATMENRKVVNRLESIRKTRVLLDRINEAVTILKKKPEGGERLFEIIHLTYITSESLNHNEILYRLNLSSRQYYRLREQAINILSIRLWSGPSKDIDFWLELVSALEEV